MKLNFSKDTLEVLDKVFTADSTYDHFSKLMFDTGCNTVADETKAKANDVIRKKFNVILGLDEKSTARDRRKAIRRNQTLIYEIIEETVENLLVSGWQENEFYKAYVEMKNIALGDENEFFSPDDSVLTVSDVSGNHHDLIRQRLGAGTSFSVKTNWYGIKIYEEFETFMAGKSDWAGFIAKVYEAIDLKLNILIHDAMMGAGAKLAPNAQFVKTGELTSSTKDTFFKLIEDVGMATGKDVIVMGTKAALRKLGSFADVDWATEDMKAEKHALGHPGTLEGGYKLVEIPQRFAKGDTATELVDNTKLFIMPVADNKFIKVVNSGEVMVDTVTEASRNRDMTYEYEVLYKMGLSVVIGLLFGVWTIE